MKTPSQPLCSAATPNSVSSFGSPNSPTFGRPTADDTFNGVPDPLTNRAQPVLTQPAAYPAQQSGRSVPQTADGQADPGMSPVRRGAELHRDGWACPVTLGNSESDRRHLDVQGA